MAKFEYEYKKNQLRELAKEVKAKYENHEISKTEYFSKATYICEMGKRYGLITELKQMGFLY